MSRATMSFPQITTGTFISAYHSCRSSRPSMQNVALFVPGVRFSPAWMLPELHTVAAIPTSYAFSTTPTEQSRWLRTCAIVA